MPSLDLIHPASSGFAKRETLTTPPHSTEPNNNMLSLFLTAELEG